jgi:hypothetical protein
MTTLTGDASGSLSSGVRRSILVVWNDCGAAGGDKGPWKKYFAEDCMYFDERDANGKVNAVLQRRNNEDVVWTKRQ